MRFCSSNWDRSDDAQLLNSNSIGNELQAWKLIAGKEGRFTPALLADTLQLSDDKLKSLLQNSDLWHGVRTTSR
jgi:hypothetical protein